MADRRTRSPALMREALMPTASRLETVERVRAVSERLDEGDFGPAAQLIRQMRGNARLRAVLETRFSALTGAEVRWHPRRDNRDGRRAAREIVEDWPRMATVPMRWQLQWWGLLAGAGLAVLDWQTDGGTLRQIPAMRAFALDGVRFDRTRLQYEVQVRRGDSTVREYLDSPSFFPARPSLASPWVVHEPFGAHSYQYGYLHSAWYSWLGLNWSQRDRYRMAEKVSTGAAIADVPHGADKQAEQEFRDDVANLRAGGVVMCEEYPDGRKFNARPFEWNSANTAGVADKAAANAAADLVILFLGTLTAAGDLQGGAGHDLASAGADITADRIDRDAEAESATLVGQMVARWAEANYGDPDLAPIREVVTDPPAKDAARAQMAGQLSQALDGLARHGVDTRLLCEEMRLPMAARGAAQAQVPDALDGAPQQSAAAPTSDGSEQPDAAMQQADGAAQQGGDMPERVAIPLTPTDIAAVVSVDEGRASLGLAAIGGEEGDRWIVEHSARVRADAAPQIADAAQAEQGRAPTDQPAPTNDTTAPPESGAEPKAA